MEKFTRSESTFLISAALTVIVFSVIAQLQFAALEDGADFTPAIPITLTVLCVATVIWLSYTVAHRLLARA